MAFVSVSRSAFEQEGQRRVNNSAVVWPAWLSLKENGVSSQMSASVSASQVNAFQSKPINPCFDDFLYGEIGHRVKTVRRIVYDLISH